MSLSLYITLYIYLTYISLKICNGANYFLLKPKLTGSCKDNYQMVESKREKQHRLQAINIFNRCSGISDFLEENFMCLMTLPLQI